MTDAWLIYLALGAFAGLMAGLLGVGGGLIIVPVLAWVLIQQEVAVGLVMHLALGTSLATIVLTSMSSLYAHHRLGHLDWRLVGRLTPGLVIGALIGVWIADGLETAALKQLFGVFEIAVGVYMLLGSPKPLASERTGVPGALEYGGVGTFIGTISSLLGIGGGTLTVPYLSWRGQLMQRAVAVSAACGLPIAVAGAIGYVIAGWKTEGLPAFSLGYLYLPALILICITSLMTAPMGAKLAHRIPSRQLKRVFALFLCAMGSAMLLS